MLFGHVTESLSDLRSEALSIGGTVTATGFSLTPRASYGLGMLSYTYNRSREQSRGFLGTTAGDPTTVDWSRGITPTHIVTLFYTRLWPGRGNIGVQARAQSGTAFTPVVAGDINGDGYFNDRAFVSGMSVTNDTSLGRELSDFMRGASSHVRSCLDRQRGSVAARNSCAGPWTMPMLNVSLSPDPYLVRLGNRGNVTLLVSNVLGGLDQLLHGAAKLHGWGQLAYADPTLLTVRGFDANANRYSYAVNSKFGTMRQFTAAFRNPFTVTLDIRLELGPDRETHNLAALLRSRPEDGRPLPEQQIKSLITRGNNALDLIMLVKDSLRLTAEQVAQTKATSQRLTTVRDSIATELARYLAGRNGNYRGEEVRQRWHAAGVASYTAYIREARTAISLWTPDQRDRAKRLPQLQQILSVQSVEDSDVEYMFRAPLASLP
jgi:hypothetical protein